MSRPFPPELQALLDKAKELGIEIQVFGGDSKNQPRQCPCPVCTQDRALKAKRETQTAQPGPAAQETGPAETKLDQVMSYLERITTELGNHITQIVEAVDGRSLTRDKELRVHVDELRADLNTEAAKTNILVQHQNRLDALESGFADLRASHRKQIGLLHKRVTKRKGEIATKANKRHRATKRNTMDAQ